MVLDPRSTSDRGVLCTSIHTESVFPKLRSGSGGGSTSWGHSDVDIVTETKKLMGNAGYGKTTEKQERHRTVKICGVKKASELINEPQFRKIECVGEGENKQTYEVESTKKMLSMKLPLQIGFFVYQYAKLRILQFYYQCLDAHLDRKDFQLMQMDTDSSYIALSMEGEKMLDELQERENQRDEPVWFPRTNTPEHIAWDKRTPWLFKLEWQGDGMVALCSKTYLGYDTAEEEKAEAGLPMDKNTRKKSHKGVQKKNVFGRQHFLDILKTQGQTALGAGVNRGFRMIEGKMKTYSQVRDGLAYFYAKREVADDGVTTFPFRF